LSVVTLYELCSANYDLILGKDFLAKNGFKFDFKRGSVKVGNILVAQENKFVCSTSRDNDSQKHVFSMNSFIDNYKKTVDPLSPIKGVEFPIVLKCEQVISLKPYSISLHIRPQLREHINMLLDRGILKHSNSIFATPCFTIPKPNGSIRLVNDLRQLNRITVPMEFYFPTITETFYRLKGNKVFSKIDLEKGFYQIEIAESDKFKTAFTCPLGKYEFHRLPFGMSNAPKFFNNMISRYLSEFENVVIFVDDILIYEKSPRKHIKSLQQIFKKLAQFNIIVNFDKSTFFTEEVYYLGYIIDGYSYRPDLSRITDFTKWKRPETETRRELQKLSGKMNWYSEFIPNLSTRIAYLYKHLKGGAKMIRVSDLDMEIVDKIYQELVKKATHTLPDPSLPFEIFADASEIGFGQFLLKTNHQ
ncbi:pol polyprotein, partial [Pseudoloma neurophilia]